MGKQILSIIMKLKIIVKLLAGSEYILPPKGLSSEFKHGVRNKVELLGKGASSERARFNYWFAGSVL